MFRLEDDDVPMNFLVFALSYDESERGRSASEASDVRSDFEYGSSASEASDVRSDFEYAF